MLRGTLSHEWADYEQMMKDSKEKRAADTTTLEEKNGAKAETESRLQAHMEDKQEKGSELLATMKVLQATHSECDWIMQYYEMRKEARDAELESLSKAKAVLSGADYSLLQKTTKHRSLRGA
eukprot:TRINITY_DN78_c1_g3_i2.p5 TRINITY_DN78_c1_g3~~TRINITY_DN78_c1_g3_i2.p5  ORF type:complete len:122 (-),score=55.56 TRINITY_DN78_c1_g3_i2:96-461(-)